jgi:hypothetical protein
MIKITFYLILVVLFFSSCTFFKLAKQLDDEEKEFYTGKHKFEFVNNQIQIVTNVETISNKRFLFDLGAPVSFIYNNADLDRIIIKENLIRGIGKLKSADGQTLKRYYYKFKYLENGLFVVRNFLMPVIDSPDTISCYRLDGLWGSNVFSSESKDTKNKVLLISMQDSTLAVLDSLPDLTDWIKIGTRFNSFGHIYIKTNIGDNEQELILDTGFGGDVIVNAETFKRLLNSGLTDSSLTQTYGHVVGSLLGFRYDTTYNINTGIRLSEQLEVNPVSVRSTKQLRVNALGMGVLQRFNIIVDYQNKSVYLQPNPGFQGNEKSFFFNKGFGLSKQAHSRLVVINIRSESVADIAGLRIGDIVLSVNGVTVESDFACEQLLFYSKLDSHKNDNEVVVQRGDETIRITL